MKRNINKTIINGILYTSDTLYKIDVASYGKVLSSLIIKNKVKRL